MEYTLKKIAKETETDLTVLADNHFEFFAIPDGRIVSCQCQVNDFLDNLMKANMLKNYNVDVKYADDKDEDFDVLQCDYTSTKYDKEKGELV